MTPVNGTVEPSTSPSGLSSRTVELLQELDNTTDPVIRRQLCDQIVEGCLALADRQAARFRDRGIELDDLRQVARTALVQAMRRFTGGGERAFLGYVIPSIRGELKRHFRDRGWSVRPPRSIQEARQAMRAAHAEVSQDLGHEPTDEELAAATGLSLDLVRQARTAENCYQADSLDRPVAGDLGTVTLGQTMGDIDHGFADAESRLVVRSMLDKLEARDRKVIFLRYFRGRTQREIGERIGVTQMQVSRIESRILRQLRETIESDHGAAA